MNYSKITDNDEVVRLLIQRSRIEKEIQKLDDKALINYELEKLAEPQANDADTRQDKCHIQRVSKALIAFFKWREGQQLTADTVNEIETFAKEYQSNL